MTTRQIAIVGAGGFAMEAIDLISEVNRAETRPRLRVAGFVDEHPNPVTSSRMAKCAVKFLGSDQDLLAAAGIDAVVLAIGAPLVREKLWRFYEAAGLTPITLVHPGAFVSTRAEVGAGSVICAGVVVSINVQLGRQVHLNPNATIGHDTILEDFVSINPAATISGNVRIDHGCMVGASAVVLEQLTIGEHSVVGACACVTRDLPANSVVVGIPARPLAGTSSRGSVKATRHPTGGSELPEE